MWLARERKVYTHPSLYEHFTYEYSLKRGKHTYIGYIHTHACTHTYFCYTRERRALRLNKTCSYLQPWELGSSVSIVSGYELDDRAIEVRSPAEAKYFSSSLCVQTGSGAHPASCKMGTGGPFPGAKALPGRNADHSPPSSVEVVNE
jgi:hypothetical protein